MNNPPFLRLFPRGRITPCGKMKTATGREGCFSAFSPYNSTYLHYSTDAILIFWLIFVVEKRILWQTMKRARYTRLFFYLFLYLAGLFLPSAAVSAGRNGVITKNIDVLPDMEIQYLRGNLGLSSSKVTAVYQDESGFLWIGTELGLYRYDGFNAQLIRNDWQKPHRLSSNKITHIEGEGDILWVGTDKGLNRLDKRNGSGTQYHFDDFSNSDEVGALLITKSGALWVGTEGGLYKYDRENDRFVLMCDIYGNSKVPHCAIKSLYEDSRHFVWIGTWDKGLFRYDPKKDEFYAMPKFNDINSAQVVYEDNRQRIWVGTWGKGLYLIENPHETDKPLQFRNFMYENTDGNLLSDYIYSIVGDPHTGLSWIGTAKGLVLLLCEDGQEKVMSLPDWKIPVPRHMFDRGADPKLCDRNGNIWISTVPVGMAMASISQKNFVSHALEEPELMNDIITCLTCDHEGNVWLGMERSGIVCQMAGTNRTVLMNHIPGIRGNRPIQKINGLKETSAGNMLVGTTRNGFIEIAADRKSARHYDQTNTAWLPDNCVYSFYEDREGNLLIGTWAGLCVRYTNGKGTHLEVEGLQGAQIQHIMQSRDGLLWLSTKNRGIVCLSGNIHSPKSLQLKSYQTPLDTELQLTDIYKTLQDKQGRIWACSQETGLMLYNKEREGFECVNQKFGISNEHICSIEEGYEGDLWISSRTHVMLLSLTADGNLANLYNFSTMDASNSYFERGISGSFQKAVYFGRQNDYLVFSDHHLQATKSNTAIAITGIKISNIPFEMLPDEERNGISTLLPPYTKQILLSPAQNNLTIEFSDFNYAKQRESRFAYMLEGHDNEWFYPEDGVFSAYYSNLSPGKYYFRLKASDINGVWQEMAQPLAIEVLPPLALRWWAILIYVLLLAAAVYYMMHHLKLREAHRRELQMAYLSKEKIEELNHKKLQFFTNITHDLMTPLTVISAKISELETKYPQTRPDYKIIRNNLNRLIRLLQQILEFRKAETGNLQLRVSKGDISDFCRREVESIQPLMNRKKLHLSLLCLPEQIVGYFDPDALDKIMYNLLSNAAKYTQEMGYVQVMLTACEGEEKDFVRLTVKDNGKGIPADRQADLFKRFYEGEHRHFNTYGTGIGLSLTKALVELHHGSISVESREGEGTTFTITFPIDVRYYKENEVDKSWETSDSEISPEGDLIQEDANSGDTGEEAWRNEDSDDGNQPYTLLIAEDNEELLMLMKKLLQRDYHILTAHNGKEGLEVMKAHKVDLVIADVMMPVMDGLEMMKQAKNDLELSHTPFIMLTAKRGEDERTEAYEAGADAYITKPFHLSTLQARIANLLRIKEKALKEIRDKLFEGFGNLDVTNADEDFLHKCIEAVQKHLNDANFDQQEFADEVATSKSTLYKKLKTVTGLNTSAFIRNIRMKAAKDIILKNPSIRISDLAYAVGYNDPKYFSSCFKKYFGVLPSEYANKAN